MAERGANSPTVINVSVKAGGEVTPPAALLKAQVIADGDTVQLDLPPNGDLRISKLDLASAPST